jgi:hypothetical protein
MSESTSTELPQAAKVAAEKAVQSAVKETAAEREEGEVDEDPEAPKTVFNDAEHFVSLRYFATVAEDDSACVSRTGSTPCSTPGHFGSIMPFVAAASPLAVNNANSSQSKTRPSRGTSN